MRQAGALTKADNPPIEIDRLKATPEMIEAGTAALAAIDPLDSGLIPDSERLSLVWTAMARSAPHHWELLHQQKYMAFP